MYIVINKCLLFFHESKTIAIKTQIKSMNYSIHFINWYDGMIIILYIIIKTSFYILHNILINISKEVLENISAEPIFFIL